MEEENNIIKAEANMEISKPELHHVEDSILELTEPKITIPIVTPNIVEEWKRWFLTQKFSLDTLDMYYSFVKRYVGYKVLINQKTIDRFREQHMNTVCSSALKSLLKFLVYKKDYPENLLTIRFERNKQTRKLPKTISPEEVQAIIDGFEARKDKLLTQTAYSLALRIEETIKIKWEDFNWSEWLNNKADYGKLKLKGTKGDKFRVLPVNPVLMKDLYECHELRTEVGIPIGNLVFGDDKKFMEFMANRRETEKLTKDEIDRRNKKHYLHVATQRYRDLLYKVSLKTIGQKVSPHVFRHSKAQWYMDRSVPIETLKDLLGHVSILTTQIYAQASPIKIKTDLQKVEVPGKPIKEN